MKIGEFQAKYGDLSHPAVAEICGCSSAAVLHWCSGENRCPLLVERLLESLDLAAGGDRGKLRDLLTRLGADGTCQPKPETLNPPAPLEPVLSPTGDPQLHADQTFLQDVFDTIQDGVCVLDSDRRILCVNQTMVESIRNITAKREADGRLRQAEEKLRESQKHESLVVMAGGIAHNFNNLLMVILGNLELAMADKTVIPGTRDLLMDIRKAGQRAAELSRQMLVFSGRSYTSLKVMDLNAGIQNLQDVFSKAIAPDTSIMYNLDYSLPPVEINQDEIQQMLSHLVTNAIEAIGEKPGTITISTGTRNLAPRDFNDLFIIDNLAAGQYVFIRIDDTGCGMDETIRKRMFDPFYSTKFLGRGLGLAEVLGIIRRHGGSIQVQSMPAAGSSVTVYLPLANTMAAGASGVAEALAEFTTAPVPKRRDTILIVDDEEDIRFLFQRILESNGYQVIHAEEGGKAMDLLAKNRDRVKAVLLDIKMPGLSGDLILADIQKLIPTTPVIIVSGYHEEEVAALFTKTKPTAYLQKPFKINTLLKVLRDVLEIRGTTSRG